MIIKTKKFNSKFPLKILYSYHEGYDWFIMGYAKCCKFMSEFQNLHFFLIIVIVYYD